jgi:hypothetical protein
MYYVEAVSLMATSSVIAIPEDIAGDLRYYTSYFYCLVFNYNITVWAFIFLHSVVWAWCRNVPALACSKIKP